MLIVSIPDLDGFNEETGQFVSMPGGVLHLEHNLICDAHFIKIGRASCRERVCLYV